MFGFTLCIKAASWYNSKIKIKNFYSMVSIVSKPYRAKPNLDKKLNCYSNCLEKVALPLPLPLPLITFPTRLENAIAY